MYSMTRPLFVTHGSRSVRARFLVMAEDGGFSKATPLLKQSLGEEESMARWIDENLPSFKGRASRDRWVAQAKLILEVGVEAFLVRAKTNDY